MCVYILHFDVPYKHAKHYTGYAENLKGRLAHHANGTGARLTQVVRNAGIGWKLARVWEGADRNFERRIKRRKEAPQLCPICNPRANKLARRTP